jgi:hypothetical protein
MRGNLHPAIADSLNKKAAEPDRSKKVDIMDGSHVRTPRHGIGLHDMSRAEEVTNAAT